MPVAARSNLLNHLREMLVEKEEVIQTLEKQLRAAQESSSRPEQASFGSSKLESGMGGRYDPLASLTSQRLGATALPPVHCNGLEQVSIDAPYDVTTHLREELMLANARCAELAAESARRQTEAADLTQEVESLRTRLSTAEAEIAVHGQLRREVESQRTRLTTAVQEASLLRSQLASRDADIVRLERSLAELEGWAPHLQGRKVDDSLRLPLKIVDDGYRHVLRGSGVPGPATSVVSTATGCEGLSTASSRGQYSSSAPGGMMYGSCDKSPKAAGAHSANQGHTWAIQTSSVRGSSSDGNAILAMAHAVSNRTRSPVRPPHRLATSPMPVTVVGTPPAVANPHACRPYTGEPPARWAELPKTPPHAAVADSSRAAFMHRSQSVPVPMRHASASPAPTRQSGHPQVSLASWAASPGSSRRSEGSMDWIPIQRATSQPPPPVAIAVHESQVVGHPMVC
mmetsp:Transcript_55872/g.130787  ORF Transcript_55872/g.130787 Transcript_55872/m.130787 type:complete len:457 (-) Transcript_55872:52-1422(-)